MATESKNDQACAFGQERQSRACKLTPGPLPAAVHDHQIASPDPLHCAQPDRRGRNDRNPSVVYFPLSINA
jgi:hypothetical protein